MKKIISVIFVLCISLVIGAAEESTLTVTFTNIEPARGQLLIALCNSKEMFEKRREPYKKRRVAVNSSSVSVTFTGIPSGEYGIKVVHDENSNNKMDTNLVKMPKEGFGFSKNAMGKMGPPTFEAAKVNVSGETQITIKMKYL